VTGPIDALVRAVPGWLWLGLLLYYIFGVERSADSAYDPPSGVWALPGIRHACGALRDISAYLDARLTILLKSTPAGKMMEYAFSCVDEESHCASLLAKAQLVVSKIFFFANLR